MPARRSFLLSSTLTLLLAACGQPQTQQPSEADPYANGASHPWTSTAPAGQLTPLTLTPGENTLQYEPILAARNGWGPIEVNRSNGEQAAGDGRTLSINGKTYSRGFGTHAGSELRFSLKGTGATCTRFTADVGVDDEVGPRGKVVFQVYLDGVKAYDSGVMKGKDAARRVEVDIMGKQELRLVVTDAGNGIHYDHADWADPKISCQAVQTPPAGGKPGTFDPTFQRIQTPRNQPGTDPLATAVQPDGKILVFGAGITPDLGPDDGDAGRFFMVRYNSDGSRDPTFGQNGMQFISAGDEKTVGQILVQPDGKIVATGLSSFPARSTPTDFVTLLRLLPNGQPDPSFGRPTENFGQTGIVLTRQVQGVSDFALQADGKIVLVEGVRGQDTFRVVRFGINGDLDASFGQGGRVMATFAPPADTVSATITARAVEVQVDGRIVVGGAQYLGLTASSFTRTVFARFLADGRLDDSFDGDGRATGLSDRFPALRLDDLMVQPNGNIVAAAVDHRGGCRLERLTATGAKDETFSDFLEENVFAASRIKLALQTDGKILASGCGHINSVGELTDRLLIRTLPNGQRDRTFGGANGSVVVEDTRNVLLQPDGKILVGLNPIVRVLP